jgi:cold shock protein
VAVVVEAAAKAAGEARSPKQERTAMATGTITRLVRDRGFGFIKPDEGSADVFFHTSATTDVAFDDLQEGQAVEYDSEPDPRQPDRTRATNVRTKS